MSYTCRLNKKGKYVLEDQEPPKKIIQLRNDMKINAKDIGRITINEKYASKWEIWHDILHDILPFFRKGEWIFNVDIEHATKVHLFPTERGGSASVPQIIQSFGPYEGQEVAEIAMEKLMEDIQRQLK